MKMEIMRDTYDAKKVLSMYENNKLSAGEIEMALCEACHVIVRKNELIHRVKYYVNILQDELPKEEEG